MQPMNATNWDDLQMSVAALIEKYMKLRKHIMQVNNVPHLHEWYFAHIWWSVQVCFKKNTESYIINNVPLKEGYNSSVWETRVLHKPLVICAKSEKD